MDSIMHTRDMNEVLAKKDNKESRIVAKDIRISMGECVKRIMKAEDVSEGAAMLLAANALDYGDVEARVDELLHGESDDEEDDEKAFAFDKIAAATEIATRMYPEAPLYDWTIEDSVGKIVDSVAEREHLSVGAARMLVSNALRSAAAVDIMERYCHWVMTGHKELPN